MDKEVADLALQFLARTDLKGHEVPQFGRVVDALLVIRDGRNEESNGDDSTAVGGTD